MWTDSNQTVPFQFQIKRASGYAQQPCGRLPVIPRSFQRFHYGFQLSPLHIQSVVIRRGHIHRKADVLEDDPVTLRQHTCTVHHILQLTDIARPRIGHESLPHIPVETLYPLSQFLVRMKKEESGQWNNILPAVFQQRDMERELVQPVEEVLPEPSPRLLPVPDPH